MKDLGKKPGMTIVRLTRYFKSLGCNKAEIENRIEQFMLRCDRNIRIESWRKYIEKCIRETSGTKLIDVPGIAVTDNELERIEEQDGLHRQAVLFTLVCLAKYYDAVRGTKTGWVNLEYKDIFSLANTTVSPQKQAFIIGDLRNSGAIDTTKKIKNTNLHVNIIDEESATAIYLMDLRNIGNQYRRLIGLNYFECKCCGLTVKKFSNAQKYCTRCAAEIASNRERSGGNALKTAE